MTAARAILFLGATLSLYWAILLAAGYGRSDYQQPVGGPPWAEEFLWKVYHRGSEESSPRTTTLPADFRNRSSRGDRVEQVHHSMEFLGLKLFAAEAFLYRDERRLDAWREYFLPFPLLVLLGALSPLLIAGWVAGSIVRATPRDPILRAEEEVPARTPMRPVTVARIVLSAAALTVLIVGWFVAGYQENGPVAVSRAAESFKGAAWCDGHPDGAWTGDVTELYRMGAIRRAVAEADAAPLRPLVPKPRPFHGYYFIAMETGPSMSTTHDEPVLLKKGNRNRETFAFCAYPAKEGPNQRVWLICPTGFFGRLMDGGKPVLRWPTPREQQQHWGRFCRLDAPGVPYRPAAIAALASSMDF